MKGSIWFFSVPPLSDRLCSTCIADLFKTAACQSVSHLQPPKQEVQHLIAFHLQWSKIAMCLVSQKFQ
jgi:hypothetical protein